MKNFGKILFDLIFKIPNDRLPEKIDAIVGIGVGLSKNKAILSPQSKAVVDKVYQIYDSHKEAKVFFSGGYKAVVKVLPGIKTSLYLYESWQMLSEFVSKLLPRLPSIGVMGFIETGVVDFENKSKNSLGNVKYTIEFLKKKYRSVVIVDFYGHLKQIKMIFQQELRQQKIDNLQLCFIGVEVPFGDNCQTRLQNPLVFLIWEILTSAYYYLHYIIMKMMS